jgi:hypothetical protein
MGYRSDVKIVIACENEYWLKKFLMHIELAYSDDPLFKEVIDPSVCRIAERTMYFHHAYMKWYPQYDYVQLHEKLMHDVQDFRGGYTFVRVGEEEGDVEKRGREYDCHVRLDDAIMIQTESHFTIDEPDVDEPYISPNGVTA